MKLRRGTVKSSSWSAASRSYMRCSCTWPPKWNFRYQVEGRKRKGVTQAPFGTQSSVLCLLICSRCLDFQPGSFSQLTSRLNLGNFTYKHWLYCSLHTGKNQLPISLLSICHTLCQLQFLTEDSRYISPESS